MRVECWLPPVLAEISPTEVLWKTFWDPFKQGIIDRRCSKGTQHRRPISYVRTEVFLKGCYACSVGILYQAACSMMVGDKVEMNCT